MESALDILSARLAKGEITEAEYRKLIGAITDASAGQPSVPMLANPLPDHHEPSYADQPARPLKTVGTVVQFAILLVCLLSAIVLAQVIALAANGEKSAAIASLDIMSGDSGDTPSMLLSAAGLLLVISFFTWLYRGTQNLHRLHIPLSIWPFGAVGWWFVPIAFFWKPYEALSQLWRASISGHDWTSTKALRLLLVWWVLFWIGLALSIGFLQIFNYDPRKSIIVVDAARAIAGIFTIVEAINIAAMLMLYRIVGKITAPHDALVVAGPSVSRPAPEAPAPPHPAFSWTGNYTVPQALGVAVLVALFVWVKLDGKGGSSSGAGSWRVSMGSDPITGSNRIAAHGYPIELSGTSIPPTLIIECNGGKPLIAFDYKQPMKDAAPDGTLDFVHVILKIGNDDPEQLSFVPSQDWTVLSQARNGAIADGTAAVLNQIFGGLIPETQNVKLSWDARTVVYSLGRSDKLITRATARNNISVTAAYDLAGFKEAYRAMPASCH